MFPGSLGTGLSVLTGFVLLSSSTAGFKPPSLERCLLLHCRVGFERACGTRAGAGAPQRFPSTSLCRGSGRLQQTWLKIT